VRRVEQQAPRRARRRTMATATATFDSPSSASSVYSGSARGGGGGGGAFGSVYGGGGGVIGTRSVQSSGTSTAYSGGGSGVLFPSWSSQSGTSQSGTRWVMRCLRKGAAPASLDWESVAQQVWCAVSNPQAAYKMTQLRKQNKNHWARDDPGVLMAALALSAACAVAWGVAFKYWSPIDHIALILHGWLQLAAAVGLVMGFTRARREALTRPRATVPHMAAPALEWAYVAETAVNAYFPLLLCAHVGLLVTAPVSLAPGWTGTLVGNALLGLGAGAFWHCVFRGFLSAWRGRAAGARRALPPFFLTRAPCPAPLLPARAQSSPLSRRPPSFSSRRALRSWSWAWRRFLTSTARGCSWRSQIRCFLLLFFLSTRDFLYLLRGGVGPLGPPLL
jgi:hypothetical protein